MSGGTISNPTGARALANGLGAHLDDGQGEGMIPPLTPRQAELNHLWSYYRCQNYDARRVDWSGRQHLEHTEHELVAQSGFIPPGFYDAGQTFPLKFRRPVAPYYLGRVIVDRFTSLLFSQRRHPKLVVEGDPDTEDWLNACVEAGHLWATMIAGRNFGGAMGSLGLGFRFVDGLPVFEAHDPRWCEPTFADRRSGKVEAFEERYAYPDVIKGAKGEVLQAWFWYRRVIDDELDVVWPKVPVGDGSEPNWDRYKSHVTEHHYGFCPIVWVQNLPVQDDVDGDADCQGAYDIIEAIDALLSQAHKGTLNNCDPTLNLATDGEMDEVMKGSDNAIKLEKGGTASYLEINGLGPKTAVELAEVLERRALRMSRCVIEQQRQHGDKTATEIDRDYSSMLEKADILREQYGERGVKPLLTMLIKAARKVIQLRTEHGEDGVTRMVRGVLTLPKKAQHEEKTGKATFIDRKLGPSDQITLRWPPYFQPTVDDAIKAVQVVSMGLTTNVLDTEHAVQYLANYIPIEDVPGLVRKLLEQKTQSSSAVETQMMNRMAASMTPNLRVK